MIRKLLATTALASLVATGAFAQDSTAPAASPAAPAATDQSNTGAMQPEGGAMNAAPAPAGDTAATPAAAGNYLQALGADQHLASNIDDATLYQGNAQDAQSVGEIENLVIGQNGQVVAAVVETSGLEDNKTVAVPFDKIEWSMGQNNEPRAVLTATREDLQAAPEFTAQSAREAANTGAMAPGTGTVASGSAATGGAPAMDTNAATTGAMGAGNTNMAAGTTAPAAPATGDANAMNSGAMGSQNGYLASLGNDQHLADNIIGSNVYSGPGQDAQTIGSVNDLVVDKSGKIAAAVVGVGGFLGIGEKNVGVPYAEITMSSEGDSDEPRLVLAATKEQLTSAPTFESRDDQATAANTGAAGSTGAMTTADTGAMAPAAGVGAAAGGAAGMAANNAAGGTAMGTDTSTTASTGGNDRSSMTAVTGPELTADNLKGTTVYGPNDQSIGSVGDIALTAEGNVDAIIVDVGGFLGIGAKPVAVAMDNLQFMRDSNGKLNVYTQFTEDQLKNAPEFNRDTYAENRSSMRLESGSAPAAGTAAPAQ